MDIEKSPGKVPVVAKNEMWKKMRLLQFTDSAFPVGTFSFSNGLETAVFENVVKDASTLEAFVKSQARQGALCDGVAALHAHRAYLAREYDRCFETDRYLFNLKMNEEARQMGVRMGKKLLELAQKLYRDEITAKWLEKIKKGDVPGMYPVAQGMVFAMAGESEEDLFCSHQYGIMNMVLGAALRCVKVSHYDTQLILEHLSEDVESLYREASVLGLQDIHAFYPELDIMASLHEKGKMRMFMN